MVRVGFRMFFRPGLLLVRVLIAVSLAPPLPKRMAPTGYLALVLHAHLPYVRHPEFSEFLEEDWLYEAIIETYLPLLDVLQRLIDEGVPFQLTMSLTPPLCHMLRDPLLQARFERYLDRSIALAGHEIERTKDDAQLGEITRFYLARLTRC